MFASHRDLFAGRDASPTRFAGAHRPRPCRRRPALEPLEGRELMTLGVELPVSTSVNNDSQSDVASSNNGLSVIVWVNNFGGADNDILAQRYDRFGHEVGPVILVDFTGANSQQPSVSMDDSGRFTVAWTNFGATPVVMMRYFNANGTAASGIIQVSDTGERSYEPDVAVNATNAITVVTYTHDFEFNLADQDIIGERFTFFGDNTGTEFTVAFSGRDEVHSAVAMAPNGAFGVVYEDISGDSDIIYRRYNAAGALVATHTINNNAVTTARDPDVDMDRLGNAVIVFEENIFADFGIRGRRVSSTGVLGAQFFVADGVNQETNPRVAVEPFAAPGTPSTQPAFVVAYDFSSPAGTGARVTEVNNFNGVAFNSETFLGAFAASISIDGFNRYTLAYTRLAGADLDIFRRTSWLTVHS